MANTVLLDLLPSEFRRIRVEQYEQTKLLLIHIEHIEGREVSNALSVTLDGSEMKYVLEAISSGIMFWNKAYPSEVEF